MKLTVLGSGTCGSQLPGVKNRFPPAFVIEDKGEKILFDCSEGVRFRMERGGFKYNEFHHVAISHTHPDHYAFVHYFQSIGCYNVWVGPKNELVNLYAPRQIVDDFPVLWRSFVPDDPEFKSPFWPELKLHAMTRPDMKRVSIGGQGLESAAPLNTDHGANFLLSAYSVYHGHGRTDACAFRLEAGGKVFAYSGDSGICDGLKDAARGADLFLCEASARIGDDKTPVQYGHLNPRVAGEIALNAGARRLVFFHYTGFDSDEDMIADCLKSGFKGAVECAKDFQVIEF